MPEIVETPDAESLAEFAARAFLHAVQAAMQNHGRFSVVLSGGSTPQKMYIRLSQPPYIEQVDWNRVFFFWGDERCVPPDHAESNFGAARKALLDVAPIPNVNIHRIPGELAPELSAGLYEQDLRDFFGGQDPPHLDLILLGLGEDGHTASLFPGSPALHEVEHWTAAVMHADGPPPLVPRVTLTLPVLNAAHEIIFLVSGENKASILARVLSLPSPPGDIYPAQLVRPVSGRVTWLADRAALAVWKKTPAEGNLE